MAKKMIINAVDPEEVRVAILGDAGVLEDFDIETRGVEKNKGNIYKGVVRAVEPALNAAFVDYGAEKEGFLTAGEVDAKALGKRDGDKTYNIADLLKPKATILVQIDKDEVGSKGAVLTTYLSLAGRYTVLMPGASRRGVSRRIADEETRNRIRDAASRLDVPEEMGVIIRTAGQDRTKTDLSRDLKVLLRVWENIKKEESRRKAPALILKERDVVLRALRDYLTSDIDEVVVDSDDAYDRAAEYMHLVMPKQKSVLSRYVERRPIFHHYRIEDQLDELYSPRVSLPSGGSIVIEPTEALVSVDVNSGKQKAGGHEETALQTNLEAAREVARQLRLRDLGGIVVVDFIDMMARRNRQNVERAVKEALKPDKARIKVGRISANGTLELTRQRLRSALRATMFQPCPSCRGTGHVLTSESHAVAVLRRLRDRAALGDLESARVRAEKEAAHHLRTAKHKSVAEIEQVYDLRITIESDPHLAAGQDELAFQVNPNREAVVLPEPDFGPPETLNGEEPAKKKRSRRRRRRKTAAAPAEAFEAIDVKREDEMLDLGLPTFELIDASELDAVPAESGGEDTEDTEDTAAPKRNRRSRRRRPRRGRRTKPEGTETKKAELPAPVAPAPMPAVDPPPPNRISRFLKKLFG
jgi:ribonuclease E